MIVSHSIEAYQFTIVSHLGEVCHVAADPQLDETNRVFSVPQSHAVGHSCKVPQNV